MKVLTLLCLLTTVTMVTGVRAGFKEMREYLKTSKEEINRGIEDMLDDSTDSGFPQEIDNILLQLKTSVCFDHEAECVSDMFFGCSCINAYKQLGSTCSQIPCNVVTFIYNDLAAALRDFARDADSVEGVTRLIMERVYTPLLKMLCGCSEGLPAATFACIENYDASFLADTGMDSAYKMVVGMLDLDSMERVMETLLAISCSEVSGEVCYLESVRALITWGEMWDNSLEGAKKRDCNAVTRVEKQVVKYVAALEGGDVEEIVKKLVKIMKKAMCPKRCQEEMLTTFYTCCTVQAAQLMEEQNLVENLSNVIDNISSLLTMAGGDQETASFNTKKNVRRYLSTYNAAELCKKKQGKEYRKKRDTCERLMYGEM